MSRFGPYEASDCIPWPLSGVVEGGEVLFSSVRSVKMRYFGGNGHPKEGHIANCCVVHGDVYKRAAGVGLYYTMWFQELWVGGWVFEGLELVGGVVVMAGRGERGVAPVCHLRSQYCNVLLDCADRHVGML